MSAWNTDIKAAPHGRYVVKQRREGVDQRVFVPERVILSTKCGKVVLSHYLPEEKRWLMLGKGEQPTAWQAWPEPYPHSLPSSSQAADSPALDPSALGSQSTRSAPFGGFGGNPSIPSFEADGAKMGELQTRPDRAAKAGVSTVNSKQAAIRSPSHTGDQ